VHYPDTLEYCPRDGNKLPPLQGETQALYDPLIGSTIDGRYIVEALLGKGGMGYVYAARHAIIDKRVAIKVLREDAAKDETAAQRFIAEAKAASKIGHQNIVDITDFGVLPDKHAYFVMEFLDGPTLAQVVGERGHLEPARAVAITSQIARGLHAAHGKGIIHRDLKPENIFVLTRDGQSDLIKIVDFGIAKDAASTRRLTQVGMVLGTPEYMSPEQATGQPTDPRVDMYALGCILYEMLAGDVPFKGENATGTLTKHVFDAVTPPSERRPELGIPPSLEAVVMRMLQKKPADRFADMRALMDELDRVAAVLSGAAPPEATPRAAPAGRSAVAASSKPTEPRRAAPAAASPTDDQLLVPARNPTGLYVAAALGTLVLVVGIALALRTPAPSEKPAPIPIAPAAGASAATAGAPAPPASASPAAPTPVQPAETRPAEVELVLTSDPPGADIYDGDEHLGKTPLTVKRARGAAPFELSFRRPGFQTATRSIVPDGDKMVEAKLLARPKVTTVAKKPSPAPPNSPAPARPPKAGHVSDLRNPFE
jgi:serine/threonine-protein kinase